MSQKNENMFNYIIYGCLSILAYSIIYSIYYIYSYIKSTLFNEVFLVNEFNQQYHLYIWLPLLFFIIYNLIWNIIENSRKIEEDTIREMPSRHHPMMINFLMNKKFTKNGFTSTIMLLINKNYLELNKDSKGYFLIDKNKISEKAIFGSADEYLIQALFRRFAIDEKLYLKELSKKNKDFNFIFINYINLFTNSKYYKHFISHDYFIFSIYTLILSFMIFICSTSVLYYNIIYALIIIIVYCILFGKSINIKWRNKEGRTLFRKWCCYKKYLKKYTYLHEKEFKEIKIWDTYLIVATALDINTKNSNNVFEDVKLGEYNLIRNLPKLHLFENENSSIY